MRLGLLPSQQRELDKAFKKARAFDRFRRSSRRAFVGMLGVSVGALVGGVWLGRRTAHFGRAPEVEPPELEVGVDLAPLHALALGPADDLERRAMHLVDGLRRYPTDERLCLGTQRLITIALSHADNAVLRARLLALVPVSAPFPAYLRADLEALATSLRR